MVDNKKNADTAAPSPKTKGAEKEKETKEKSQTLELSFLEADDDFEEFPTEEWKKDTHDEVDEESIWEDNWDDDNIEEDFAKQLK